MKALAALATIALALTGSSAAPMPALAPRDAPANPTSAVEPRTSQPNSRVCLYSCADGAYFTGTFIFYALGCAGSNGACTWYADAACTVPKPLAVPPTEVLNCPAEPFEPVGGWCKTAFDVFRANKPAPTPETCSGNLGGERIEYAVSWDVAAVAEQCNKVARDNGWTWFNQVDLMYQGYDGGAASGALGGNWANGIPSTDGSATFDAAPLAAAVRNLTQVDFSGCCFFGNYQGGVKYRCAPNTVFEVSPRTVFPSAPNPNCPSEPVGYPHLPVDPTPYATCAAPANGPPYGGSSFVCLQDASGSDRWVPVKRSQYGQIGCMSTNSWDCIWAPKDCCERLAASATERSPYFECGSLHYRLWKTSGYSDPSHWCYRGWQLLNAGQPVPQLGC